MTDDLGSRAPKYQRIADVLRREIKAGRYQPGEKLPPETNLLDRFRSQFGTLSLPTLRQAVAVLRAEGLVEPRQGIGTFVKANRPDERLRWHLSEFEHPDHTMLTTSDAWESDIESQGHDPATDPQRPEKALTLERIPPPPSISKRLGMNSETDVCVVRRHIRYIDGHPAVISDDFFDQEIVRGTELDVPENTTRENILAEAGYEQVYDIDEIITRMPTQDEIGRLEIAAGTPIVEHIRTGYTATNQAVRVMISIIPGDTLILQYTIPT